MSDNSFDELKSAADKGGAAAVLDRLVEKLKKEEAFHELLQARLMQCRYQLGLPVAQPPVLDKLHEPLRTQVEDAYVAAYREVGMGLLRAGRLREGWMYLRPLGDAAAVAQELEKIEPDDENVDELVEIAVHEGVAPKRGFQILLKEYGICNSITMYESAMHHRSVEDQQQVVELLVDYLHHELKESLAAEITRQEGTAPAEGSIAEMVAERDWLFTDNAYHIDTSHLHSVVRFSRLVDNPAVLAKVIDLCEYGRRLAPQFQYQTEEPFADVYADQQRFFEALIGRNADEAVDYFRHKAQTLPPEEHGLGPAEVYVALLARLGRDAEAMQAAAELLPPQAPLTGFAPSLVELATRTGNFQGLMEACRKRDDVLGFAAGLVECQLSKS